MTRLFLLLLLFNSSSSVAIASSPPTDTEWIHPLTHNAPRFQSVRDTIIIMSIAIVSLRDITGSSSSPVQPHSFSQWHFFVNLSKIIFTSTPASSLSFSSRYLSSSRVLVNLPPPAVASTSIYLSPSAEFHPSFSLKLHNCCWRSPRPSFMARFKFNRLYLNLCGSWSEDQARESTFSLSMRMKCHAGFS